MWIAHFKSVNKYQYKCTWDRIQTDQIALNVTSFFNLSWNGLMMAVMAGTCSQ